MSRIKYLLVFLLLFLLVVSLYFDFQILREDKSFLNNNVGINIGKANKIFLKSELTNYELVKSDKFNDLQEYLEKISFWQGVFDFRTRNTIKPKTLTIYLSDEPRLSDRVRNREKGIDISSFDYEVTGESVSVFVYTNVDGVMELNFDKDAVFNQALMRALYFTTKKDVGVYFADYLDEVSKIIRETYKEPYINIQKKTISSLNIFTKMAPEAKAQTDCERWQCGTPTYDYRCGGDPNGLSCTGPGDLLCSPESCQYTLVSCDPAYWEGDPSVCGSPGGNCPNLQCVVPYSYVCTCEGSVTPTPGGGTGGCSSASPPLCGGTCPSGQYCANTGEGSCECRNNPSPPPMPLDVGVLIDMDNSGGFSSGDRKVWSSAMGYGNCGISGAIDITGIYVYKDTHPLGDPVGSRGYNDSCFNTSIPHQYTGPATRLSPEGYFYITVPPGYSVIAGRSWERWNSDDRDNCQDVAQLRNVPGFGQTWVIACNGRENWEYYQLQFLISQSAPYCTINVINMTMEVGQTEQIPFNINEQSGGNVDQVTFTLGDSTNFSVCDLSYIQCPSGQASYTDTVSGFGAKITAFAPGSTTVTTSALMQDEGNILCTGDPNITATVTVNDYSPWFQRE